MRNRFHPKIKVLIAIIALIGIALLLFFLINPKPDDSEDIIWREYPVSTGDITASLDGNGKVELLGFSHGFAIPLTLEDVFVKPGEWVNEGDQLASFNKEKMDEQIEETTLSIEKARRFVEDAKINLASQQLQHKNNTNEGAQTTENQYQSQKKELEHAIVSSEKNISNSEEKIAELLQKIRSAESSEDYNVTPELERLLEKKARLEDALKQLQQAMKDDGSSSQIAMLESQKSVLQAQLKDNSAEITRITNATNILNGLKSELADVQGQIKGMLEDDPRLTMLLTREQELQRQISGMVDEPGKLSGLRELKKSLVQQIDSLKAQISALTKANRNESKILDIQEDIYDINDAINQFTTKQKAIDSLNAELDLLEETLETYREQLSDTQEQLEELQRARTEQLTQGNQNQTTQNQIHGLTMSTLENAVKNAQTEVDRLEKNHFDLQELLNTPTLTAKTSGVVTGVNFSKGDEVPAGKAIIIIGEDSEAFVKIQIPQEDINRIMMDISVELIFPAYPDITFTGIVTEKSYTPIAAASSVSYEVTIKMDETEQELLEGMTCSVNFILKRVENVLTLSNKAIRIENGKQMVTVRLSDGITEERQITTGFSDGRISEVLSGLVNGDVVVVAG
ncbi:efflux RND transporter periplasmic adaptor subunit [Desulfosporosinus nitroreducens]|uniref:HlyD family efflux transporter periplasmic adaptor subunit n=1 Tax=Desulfosporosinus nitroreducens TaxID=2018668 RepID=A0ABT8R0C0_9FIRM|nr:efflux RND transporter periplasmic adaptor subunit [Desulfosporosinus nitroreducens]MDO0825541.1 HlyD family efflux transporter periplasmic adaptor subunit [Desulfosporosinus nitroreducens]